MKILMVAAHPDDEILGLGGTLFRHVNNRDDVYICIVTKAYEPEWSKKYIVEKINEQKKVDNFIGIKKRFNLDFPTVKLNTIPHGKLNKKITEIINSVNPDIIYTHFENDLNYDHTLIFRACMVATRPPKKIGLYCFETLSETEFNNKVFQPNKWINISKYINKKIKAFQIYKSEVKKYPHPRSIEGIEILAKRCGTEAYMKFAEAFMLIKDYW
jgi:LmbE family N-acetylglucosaminyl deacetylase